jgi:hypothetical protein
MEPQHSDHLEYLLTAVVCFAAAAYLIWQLWLR